MLVTDAMLVNWSKKIRRENGRAHSLAVLTLHHILHLIEDFNRFKRISYKQLEDDLGVTQSQMLAAMDTLEKCGVIHRDIRFEQGRNKLYVSVDKQALADITPHDDFSDTPEKPRVYKKCNNVKSNSNVRGNKKTKEKAEQIPIFQRVSAKESPAEKTKGMVKFERVQSRIESAKSYELQHLDDSQIDELWEKLKFRFFNQGGAHFSGDVVYYETDQKLLCRMYFDQLFERCGNIKALTALVSSLRFTDLKRISVTLWNTLKESDDVLLQLARSEWGNEKIMFGAVN